MLVFIVMISVMGLVWLYASLPVRDSTTRTQQALGLAQTALIGRAVADANRVGSLPCPDTNNDGVAELLAGVQCPSYIGRLPWRTLGLSDVRDAAGERLWYALSPDARDATGNIINSVVTIGQLQINTSPQQLAVVFAPHVVIAPQLRDNTQQNNVGQYLDGSNANGDQVYESRNSDDAEFNDQVRAISQVQVFRQAEKHALQQFVSALQQYDAYYHAYAYAGNALGDAQTGQLTGYIPYATLNLASSSWAQNHWFDALANVPYSVNAALDSVEMQLRYCVVKLTRGGAPMVQCV